MSLKIDKWRAEGAEGTHYAHNTEKKITERKKKKKQNKRKSDRTVGLINLKRTLKSRCDNRSKERRRKKNTQRERLGEFRLILKRDIYYILLSFLFFFLSFPSVSVFRSFFRFWMCVCLARKPVVTEIRQCQDMVQSAILESLPLRQQSKINKLNWKKINK